MGPFHIKSENEQNTADAETYAGFLKIPYLKSIKQKMVSGNSMTNGDQKKEDQGGGDQYSLLTIELYLRHISLGTSSHFHTSAQ